MACRNAAPHPRRFAGSASGAGFGLRLLVLAAFCGPLALTAPGHAAEDRINLAFRLSPGRTAAYDGRFILRVPAGSSGQSLVLSSVSYGVLLRVEGAAAGGGAELVAEYDRFESATRARSAVPSSPVGRRFRLRLAPDLQTPSSPWPVDWGGLLSVCVSWPSLALRVGEGWHDEDRADLAGGGQTAYSRDYRLCAVEPGADYPVAILEYSERGAVTGAPVRLGKEPALLSGEVRGVGQVRFDTAAGVIQSGATVTTFEGFLSRAGAAPVPTRLEAESSFSRRPPAR